MSKNCSRVERKFKIDFGEEIFSFKFAVTITENDGFLLL